MSSNIERDIGSILARISNIESNFVDIKKDVKDVHDYVVAIKGGWKGLTIAGGIGGAVATAALKLGPFIAMLPK